MKLLSKFFRLPMAGIKVFAVRRKHAVRVIKVTVPAPLPVPMAPVAEVADLAANDIHRQPARGQARERRPERELAA